MRDETMVEEGEGRLDAAFAKKGAISARRTFYANSTWLRELRRARLPFASLFFFF
jgi:hypothetical protein